MARPSAPRFLNYGDAAELPVVLQNQTDQAMNVNVAVRASNADLTEGAAVASRSPRTTASKFASRSRRSNPARRVSRSPPRPARERTPPKFRFPVYTPATTEAFATYGVIDNGSIAQPVKAPADAVKTFGGLEITTASTQLQELTDAVIYLVNYPYSDAPNRSLRASSPSPRSKTCSPPSRRRICPRRKPCVIQSTQISKRLQGLQNDDGGFGFWRRGEPSFPYVSVHVAHALVRAQSKGFAVPEEMLKNSQDYLRDIEAEDS